MKLKIRIIKSQPEDWYCSDEGKIHDVKFYPFNPEEYYQTLYSSTFSPELIRISDCEIIREEEQVAIARKNYDSLAASSEANSGSIIDQVLFLVSKMKPEERIQLFERIKLNYNLKA